MAPKAGNIFHSHPMDFPVGVTTETCFFFRPEGVHRAAVTVLASELFHKNVSSMSCGFVHGQRSLGGFIPMTFRACFPWRLISMGLGSLPVSGKNKFDKQSVLFDHAELVALLARDVTVPAQLPRRIRFPHEMTAVAELGILLDIIVIPDSEYDTQDRNNEHKGNKNGLVSRAQTPLQLVEYL
jgi:hypothetical protein